MSNDTITRPAEAKKATGGPAKSAFRSLAIGRDQGFPARPRHAVLLAWSSR